MGIDRYTMIFGLLLIGLAPLIVVAILLVPPTPLKTALTILVFIAFSITFDIRKNR